MKKFLIFSSTFLAVFLLIVGGLSIGVAMAERRAYEYEILMSAGKSVVALGDSQMQNAFNDDDWHELFNYNLPSSWPSQRMALFVDILNKNPNRVEYLILDLAPYQYYTYTGEVADGRAGNYFLLYFWHRNDSLCESEPAFVPRTLDFVKRCLLKRVSRLFKYKNLVKKGKYRSYTDGRGKPLEKSSFNPANEAMYQKSVRLAKERVDTFNKMTDINGKMWRNTVRLIDYALAQNIKVVLITTPVHVRERGGYDHQKEATFFNRVSALAEEKNIPYINCYNWEFPDLAWYDANHLNSTGAKVFTARFKEAFDKIYRDGGH